MFDSNSIPFANRSFGREGCAVALDKHPATISRLWKSGKLESYTDGPCRKSTGAMIDDYRNGLSPSVSYDTKTNAPTPSVVAAIPHVSTASTRR